MFALTDVNSCYCSCESAWDLSLRGKPLVVASNNDGAIVARSPEAKAMGIPMGEPLFKFKHLIRAGKLHWRSSNYELYASMSDRFIQTVASLSCDISQYSIDEVFSVLTGIPDLRKHALTMRERVLQWTMLPCCVGVANTLTLCKFSNHLAKKGKSPDGVCVWDDFTPTEQARMLASQPVNEIWGIGRRLTERLERMSIKTAFDLQQADPKRIRAQFGVVVERTVLELNGISCIPMPEWNAKKEQIIRSRSFGKPVFRLTDLTSAISTHVATAAEALRKQQGVANTISVWIHTNPFNPQEPQYSGGYTLPVPTPTCDTLRLTEIAVAILKHAYRKGFAYKKAGIMLGGIEGGPAKQADWLTPADDEKRLGLLRAMDQINNRWGRETIKTGATKLGTDWKMNRDNLSPCYTTRWEDLPLER